MKGEGVFNTLKWGYHTEKGVGYSGEFQRQN